MDNSPSSQRREELQEAFEALYDESLKLAKRDKELKESLKKTTFKKEALVQ